MPTASQASRESSPRRVPLSLREARHGPSAEQPQHARRLIEGLPSARIQKQRPASAHNVQRPLKPLQKGQQRRHLDDQDKCDGGRHTTDHPQHNQSRRASGESLSLAPSIATATGAAKKWILPAVRSDATEPDRDLPSVLSALAGMGMSTGVGDLLGREGQPGASLAVGLIDAILLKLESGMPYEFIGSPLVRRALVPVIDAACAQIRSTEERRLHLLADLEISRRKLKRQADFHGQLEKLCESAQYSCPSRKLREASEAVQTACSLAIQEKESLEAHLAKLEEERERLAQRLQDDQATLLKESAAWEARRESLVVEEVATKNKVADLEEKVPVVEARLEAIQKEGNTFESLCTRVTAEVEALPEMEMMQISVNMQFAELRASVRNAQMAMARKKIRGKNNRAVPEPREMKRASSGSERKKSQ